MNDISRDFALQFDGMSLADVIEQYVLDGKSLAGRHIFSEGVFTEETEWPVRFYDPISEPMLFGIYDDQGEFKLLDDGFEIICNEEPYCAEIKEIKIRYWRLLKHLSDGLLQGISDYGGNTFRIRKPYWSHPGMLIEIVGGDLRDSHTGDVFYHAIQLRVLSLVDDEKDEDYPIGKIGPDARKDKRTKYDWDAVIRILLKMALHPDGLPQSLNKIVEKIQLKYAADVSSEPGVSPGTSTLKTEVSKWLPDNWKDIE